MSPLLATVCFGLLASASWGAGDFSGAMATKRIGAVSVVALSHLLGLALMPLIALLVSEPLPEVGDLLLGALAGLCGTVGLVALYRALSSGRMGIAAPVASVISAGLPLLLSLALGHVPGTLQAIGFVCGLASVWLIGRTVDMTNDRSGLGLAVIAGVGFAAFFICLDRLQSTAVFWPLTAARAASTAVMLGTALYSGRPLRVQDRRVMLAVVGAGVLDVLGNVAFVLATQNGELGVAAVVSALYPAMTVLLARFFLREHVTRPQMVGIGLALAAVALISMG